MSDGRWWRGRGRATPAVPAYVADAALLLTLGAVALLAFRSTFWGWRFLLVGTAGLALGAGAALLARRLRLPVVVMAGWVAIAYLLLGAPLALGRRGTAALPTPETVTTVARGAVESWKALLTTLPPIDGGEPLLVPYLLGLSAGAAGMTAAIRLRAPAAPVVVLLALQIAVIALGVADPGAVALPGAAVGIGAIGWVSLRRRRLRARRRSGERRGLVVGAALGVVATVAALLGGPAVVGPTPDRVVARSYVEPPFDVGQYGSPLAAFRTYTRGYQTDDPQRRLYDQELLRVSGLPDGARLRIATLDAYDGQVWTAADDSGVDDGPADTFQRVGSRLDNPAARGGPTVSGTVTIGEGYAGVWVPAPGALTRIEFRGGAQADLGRESFRYNLVTSTGVLPAGLQAGDSYDFAAVLPKDDLAHARAAWPGAGSEVEAATRLASLAAAWAPGDEPPLRKVRILAERLRGQGSYTDGEPPNEQYPAGHSLRRLADFTADGSAMAGNDEQYAALMAILANQVGVPARVVLGAVPDQDGVVRGRDVHAWVELRVADGSWRRLDWPEFMSTDRQPEQQAPQPTELVEGHVVPPPAPVRPPMTSGDPLDREAQQQGSSEQGAHSQGRAWLRWLAAAAVPLLLLGLALLVVGGKAWRRRRRRGRGPAYRRLELGWQEVLDRARDFGHRAPAHVTRREQAAALARAAGLADAPAIAHDTDLVMFAAAPPTSDAAESCWRAVDGLLRDLAGSRGRWSRLRAALDPRTLFVRR